MIYICSDHGGLKLKELLIKYLKTKSIGVEDLGPYKLDPTDDFTVYVKQTVTKVLENKRNKGIVICKNGVGVSIMANRYKGIRAGLTWDVTHTASAVNDDDINVLALPAEYISEQKTYMIVDTWLNTKAGTDERYLRRQKQLDIN